MRPPKSRTVRTPFKCRFCKLTPKQFATGDELVEHAEAKHPEEVSALRRRLDSKAKPLPNDQ
jgi:hypothetical protein